jgi:hypothetical protein
MIGHTDPGAFEAGTGHPSGTETAAAAPARLSAALRWWAVVLAALAVLAAGSGATVWLYEQASSAGDIHAARIEAIKTGLLGTGAGTAGMFVLLLAARRQWHQEHTAAAARDSAVEERVAELYIKAVALLGDAKAPVRLGGLYALERLAQGNPGQRQTVVNVICAYLRMPWEPSVTPVIPHLAASGTTGNPAILQEQTAQLRERIQEREVRRSAQRILTDHLRRGPGGSAGKFWPGNQLDLTGAHLVEFNFSDGCAVDAAFGEAHFAGGAVFTGARFDGDVDFTAARFDHAADRTCADFSKAHFNGRAGLGAAFDPSSKPARFDEAQFNEGLAESCAPPGWAFVLHRTPSTRSRPWRLERIADTHAPSCDE